MRTYIINLDKDKIRLKNTINQLETYNILDYHRIQAIYGKELDLKNFPKRLTKEQIGCFLSHINTLYKIIIDDIDIALVLEDDVTLSEWFPKLDEIINTLPEDFDICWVGNCRSKWPRNNCNIIPDPPYEYEKLEKINDFIWKVDGNSEDNYPMGAYGLVFSKKGAKESLKIALDNKYSNPIDVVYVKSNLNKYMTIPSIITHCYNYKSNITDTMFQNYINPFENIWKKNPKQEIACLEILDKITESGIDYSIIYGTLLGYARNKKFISYDDDIDIIINRKDLKKFKNMFSVFINFMNIYELEDKKMDLHYKFFPKDISITEEIKGYNYRYPFIDVFVYDKINKNEIYTDNIIYIMSDEIIIDYMESYSNDYKYKIKVFKDYTFFLNSLYKNWENVCISSTWNHRLERSQKKSEFLCKNIILK